MFISLKIKMDIYPFLWGNISRSSKIWKFRLFLQHPLCNSQIRLIWAVFATLGPEERSIQSRRDEGWAEEWFIFDWQPASHPSAYLIIIGQTLLKFEILAWVIKPKLTFTLNEDHLKWKKTSKYLSWNKSLSNPTQILNFGLGDWTQTSWMFQMKMTFFGRWPENIWIFKYSNFP